jgi:hypothetical protein
MTVGLPTKRMKTRWPAICGARVGSRSVGRFCETAPGFGGSQNRPTMRCRKKPEGGDPPPARGRPPDRGRIECDCYLHKEG